MLYPRILGLTLLIATPLHAEQEGNFFFEAGVGMLSEDWLLAPTDSVVGNSLAPMVQLGLGWETALTPDWQIATSVSISHAQTDNFRFDSPMAMRDADLENTGVWLNSKVAYTAMSDSVRPFVSIGAGRIYGRYTDAQSAISDWQTGYSAFAGLEFDITPGFNFSFAFGHVDTGDLDCISCRQ